MATKDTVVQELVINTLTHKQFKAAQKAGALSPYELYGTPDSSVRLPVLASMWFDHIVNDPSWLRADTFSWQSGDVYIAAYNHLVDDINGKTKQSETVGGTTIEFILADDGHKICTPDQEPNLIALYEATGVAWYYVLDTDNKQFKLPRELPLYADHAPIYGNTARQGDGNGAKGEPLLASTDKVSGTSGITTGGSSGTAGVEYYVGFQQIENAYADVGALRVASDGSQKHLYFYVGHFEQDELEKNAGITAEQFNAKADLDLMNTASNVDIVIESQLPTAENGYTWYRKYKSGWVEQGGSPTGNSSTVYTGTLPVEMADTNYSLVVQFNVTSSGTGGYSAGWATKTTTGFTTRGYGSGNSTVNTPNWYVAGMAHRE